jgi:hypothetical protein
MNMKTTEKPVIGAGLESVLALTFAGGMFAIALLRPVIDLWLSL